MLRTNHSLLHICGKCVCCEVIAAMQCLFIFWTKDHEYLGGEITYSSTMTWWWWWINDGCGKWFGLEETCNVFQTVLWNKNKTSTIVNKSDIWGWPFPSFNFMFQIFYIRNYYNIYIDTYIAVYIYLYMAIIFWHEGDIGYYYLTCIYLYIYI